MIIYQGRDGGANDVYGKPIVSLHSQGRMIRGDAEKDNGTRF